VLCLMMRKAGLAGLHERTLRRAHRWSGVDRAQRYRRRNGGAAGGDDGNPLPKLIDPITLEPVVTPAISPFGHVMGLATWKACPARLAARRRRSLSEAALRQCKPGPDVSVLACTQSTPQYTAYLHARAWHQRSKLNAGISRTCSPHFSLLCPRGVFHFLKLAGMADISGTHLILMLTLRLHACAPGVPEGARHVPLHQGAAVVGAVHGADASQHRALPLAHQVRRQPAQPRALLVTGTCTPGRQCALQHAASVAGLFKASVLDWVG
jgi:hypothetical protein